MIESPQKAITGPSSHALPPRGHSLSLAPDLCDNVRPLSLVPLPVQAKLAIGEPDDDNEREADRVAETVMRMPEVDDCCQSNPAESLQRQATNAATLEQAPSSVHETLRSHGQPLDAGTRAFMEPRFGHDFSRVRVHADRTAVESARAVNALAYTIGQDVVIDGTRYTPGTMEGKRLLGHELTHVVQQRAHSGSFRLQRQAGFPMTLPQSTPHINPARIAALDRLLVRITEETDRSVGLRSRLECLPTFWTEDRYDIESGLDASRKDLIQVLGQRISLLEEEIASLRSRIGPNPTSSSELPETSELGTELASRERELHQHELQLRGLERWRARQTILETQTQIEAINRETLELPPLNPAAPTSEMSDPRAQELMNRRTNLERQQRQQARLLTSTTTPFKQTDPRWASRRYGASANCTNVAAAGCGPTSLAILMNYLYQEDPEAVAASSDLEIVSPPATADYAATHGRVCNRGTAGDTMVTNVHTQWPGFHGSAITLDQAVAHLRSGDLVIFLCKNCAGQNAAGQNRSYGGHFMVLNGVDDDASQFNVIDPERHNIARISRNELSAHTAGFWTVVRK
jgi:hypothetical protein